VREREDIPAATRTGVDGGDEGGDEAHRPGGDIGDGDGARLGQFVADVVHEFGAIADDLEDLFGVLPELAGQAQEIWSELAERVPPVIEHLQGDNPDTQQSNLRAHGLAGLSLDAKLQGFARAREFWNRHRHDDTPGPRNIGFKKLYRWTKSILDSLINVVKTNTAARAILETLGEGIDLISNLINDVEDDGLVLNS
jgi:hypothetical protein